MLIQSTRTMEVDFLHHRYSFSTENELICMLLLVKDGILGALQYITCSLVNVFLSVVHSISLLSTMKCFLSMSIEYNVDSVSHAATHEMEQNTVCHWADAVFRCCILNPAWLPDPISHRYWSPSWQSCEASRQCRALNANGLITIVSLTVLHLNETGFRSVGMRH
uniref:Uncharacterized protein n=1 Tax=Arundo donax TaxID=35708 RepID=A0A0A9HUM5_ARUDO